MLWVRSLPASVYSRGGGGGAVCPFQAVSLHYNLCPLRAPVRYYDITGQAHSTPQGQSAIWVPVLITWPQDRDARFDDGMMDISEGCCVTL